LQAQGYLTLVDQPIGATRDSTVWRGSADLLGAASRVVRDSVVAARLRAAEKGVFDLLRARSISFAEGRFVIRADGSVYFDASVSSAGALLYSIHGERLSTTTLAPR
jgi:hypothetical protein